MPKELINLDISVLILSGGLSRRMNGVDKGFVEFNGKPMIQHVIENVGFDTTKIMINTGCQNAEYLQLGCELITDKLTGSLGPLAGIHAGLCEASTQHVFVVPCDTPYITQRVCQRLYAALQANNATMTVAHDGERLHATVAVIDVNVRDELERYLLQGGRRVMSWYKEQEAIEVDCSDLKESFVNINTLDELRLAQKNKNLSVLKSIS